MTDLLLCTVGSTTSAIQYVGFEVDTRTIAKCQTFGTYADSVGAFLTCFAAVSALPAMKLIALKIVATSKADRRCL